jgi:hypothetical protein
MKTTANDGTPPSETYDGQKAMQVQLARLFGAESKHARTLKRSPLQWRKTLRAVLDEIYCYVAVNVDTDELHRSMLLSGLAAAAESLKQDDFWAGYAEGITRLALILLGDYPDHRKRKHGRKQDSHYKLDRARSVRWVQTPEQRFVTLLDAGSCGFPPLSAPPRNVLFEFRAKYGTKPDHAQFLEWYRVHFPQDYAAIFR